MKGLFKSISELKLACLPRTFVTEKYFQDIYEQTEAKNKIAYLTWRILAIDFWKQYRLNK